jgi:hypothetical protein
MWPGGWRSIGMHALAMGERTAATILVQRRPGSGVLEFPLEDPFENLFLALISVTPELDWHHYSQAILRSGNERRGDA